MPFCESMKSLRVKMNPVCTAEEVTKTPQLVQAIIGFGAEQSGADALDVQSHSAQQLDMPSRTVVDLIFECLCDVLKDALKRRVEIMQIVSDDNQLFLVRRRIWIAVEGGIDFPKSFGPNLAREQSTLLRKDPLRPQYQYQNLGAWRPAELSSQREMLDVRGGMPAKPSGLLPAPFPMLASGHLHRSESVYPHAPQDTHAP